MRSILFAAALVLVASAAPARADDPACAKFENPLEYNACLARLGPRAGATRGVPEQPADTAPAMRGVRSMRAFAGARRTNGRVRMEFTIRPR